MMRKSNNLQSYMGATMKRFGNTALFLSLALGLASCSQAGPDIDHVQTGLVEKSMFEGEWWYGLTVVDVDADEAMVTYGAFDGMMAWADLGIDQGNSGSMARIRWVIDENFLFAYRAYELIAGGNDDGRDPDFRGQPLAAFPIEAHVNVRYDYDTSTGEPLNVRVENSDDQRWYETKYMRVDWSQNVISQFYMLDDADLGSGWRREPAPFYFQEGAHGEEFPDSWRPQFVHVSEDPDYRYAEEWQDADGDPVHYMSLVTQQLLSPGINCLVMGLPCQTAAVTVRNSFLRIPPDHQYASATETHAEFDRFGLIRQYGRTYVRGGQNKDDVRTFCRTDQDCGIGGACDTEVSTCVGGLSSDRGETDFLTFYRPRHNFWKNALTETTCLADWECTTTGSICDRAARRCTVPPAERELRQVAYHLNAGFPKHLVTSAFQVIGDWNGVFMEGRRAELGAAAPSGPPISCQNTDPTQFCFCGSPHDSGDGTCPYQYDPYQTPSDAAAAGVENPFNCYIRRPEGFTEPTNPTAYEDYAAPLVYQHEFAYDEAMGDSECMFVLKANSCDADPEAACEELGDIRYQFFNYIDHSIVFFGGVSIPLMDPKSGELVVSNANMAAESIESIATSAVNYFPVLRGESSTDAYLAGEELRTYYERIGRTEHPVGVAASGTDGYSVDDPSRPGMPTNLAAHFRNIMEDARPRFQGLQGREGRAQIMSDRMRSLAGTEVESRLMGALGSDGREALNAMYDVNRLPADTSLLDPEILDQASPFRGNMIEQIQSERTRWTRLGKLFVDPPLDISFQNRNLQYFADAFEGREDAEASIRMQQMYLRGVMHHEMGHSIGLMHNFAGTFDRNNYHDGYYNIAMDDLALPRLDDFDRTTLGGNADGNVSGQEANNYIAELRRVRNERHARGAGITMTSTVMDYHGDLGILSGLGHYDRGATFFNYFDKLEAFDADPRHASADSLDGIELSNATGRSLLTYYRGGESCAADTDCAFSAENAGAGQSVFQRCLKNPRYTTVPTACGADSNCVCSTFDTDFDDYVFKFTSLDDSIPYAPDADGDGALDHYPVRYLYCNDDRANDISWCSRGDAGESFQETVDHFRRQWEEGYPLAYYRRFRANGARGGSSVQSIIDAAKIYQHLFFRYFYEPGFSDETGPLGFQDQFMASVDVMNWLTEMVQLPDTGAYAMDTESNVYRRIGDLDDPEAVAAADFSLTPGEGFPLWSEYQDGYFGFFRTERAGVFYDKYIAMLALAIRDWGFSYTLDERFYINFYDLFPVEMTEFFGGLMIGDAHWYAPRVSMAGGSPEVQNLTWYRGTCRIDGELKPCRGAQTEVYPGTPIGDTTPEILRDWASILALAQFPVYYDTTYEQRAVIFRAGSGEGWDLPDMQADGEPTCAYGTLTIEDSHVTGCADPDYVVYQSDRLHTRYMAVKVRSRLEYNLEEEQTSYQMLRRMVELQGRVQELAAIERPSPAQVALLSSLQNELVRSESFVEYLMDIQRRYGISNSFF